MARKPRETTEEPELETTEPAPAAPEPPRPPGGAPGILPSGGIGHVAPPSHAARRVAQEPTGPRAKKFRVTLGGYYACGGLRQVVRTGKVVDATTYDIRSMLRAGIQLAEIPAEEVSPEDLYEQPPPPAPTAKQYVHPSQMDDAAIARQLDGVSNPQGGVSLPGVRGSRRGYELEVEQLRRAGKVDEADMLARQTLNTM